MQDVSPLAKATAVAPSPVSPTVLRGVTRVMGTRSRLAAVTLGPGGTMGGGVGVTGGHPRQGQAATGAHLGPGHLGATLGGHGGSSRGVGGVPTAGVPWSPRCRRWCERRLEEQLEEEVSPRREDAVPCAQLPRYSLAGWRLDQPRMLRVYGDHGDLPGDPQICYIYRPAETRLVGRNRTQRTCCPGWSGARCDQVSVELGRCFSAWQCHHGAPNVSAVSLGECCRRRWGRSWSSGSNSTCISCSRVDLPGGSRPRPVAAVPLRRRGLSARCLSWAGARYRTFDGTHFHFSGGCTYSLAEATDGTWGVTVSAGDPRVLHMTFGMDTVVAQGRDISVNGVVVPEGQPYLHGGLSVTWPGDWVAVASGLGVRVALDGHRAVTVAVGAELWGGTWGLCGSYNDDPTDDFLQPGGDVATLASTFGNSWKVPDEEFSCEDAVELGCSPDNASRLAAEATCSRLLAEPFRPCHHKVDPGGFHAACLELLCRDAGRWLRDACDTFAAYARECAQHQSHLQWRHHGLCGRACAAGQIFSDCVSSCPATCGGAGSAEEPSCRSDCAGGCECAPGLHRDGHRCVPLHACSCLHRDRRYRPGQSIRQRCNRCTCRGGQWLCTQDPCPAECEVLGGHHFLTFDQQRFSFEGSCAYTLVQDFVKGELEVTMEHTACDGHQHLGCFRSISVNAHGVSARLHGSGEVTVDGQEVTLPFSSAGMNVRHASSSFLLLQTSGAHVLWGLETPAAYITLQPTFARRVRGLCGTFNWNQQDEFTTPAGDVETSVSAFANSYRASGACPVLGPVPPDPCGFAGRRDLAEATCAVLLGATFQLCHQVVEPEPFVQLCLLDACGCRGARRCLCPVLAAYAWRCAREGTTLAWRNHTFCGWPCRGGQQYLECGPPCGQTCRDLLPDGATTSCPELDSLCVPGCHCPPGLVLDEGGQCVPPAACPCHHGNEVLPPGSRIQQGCDTCVCVAGSWRCAGASCPLAARCPAGLVHAPGSCLRRCLPSQPNGSCDGANDGCVCPPGTLYLEGRCVSPEECPCQHGGRLYQPNATITHDCNTCVCRGQRWLCGHQDCAGTCVAVGDSHYVTFDGRAFSFLGDCEYLLVREATGLFSVTAENVPCGTGGVTCTKSVVVVMGGTVVHMLRGRDVTVNGVPVQPPKLYSGTGLALERAGLFLLLLTRLGLTVMWDGGTRVSVRLDPRHRGRVAGLCGNFDGDAANDLRSRGGAEEPTAQSFGHSWRLSSLCPAGSAHAPHPCAAQPWRRRWSRSRCSVLLQGLFAPCHRLVPAQRYHQWCLFDACGCDSGGDCECLCTAIAAYAEECGRRGLHIRWRSQDLCPLQCDGGQQYSPCGPPCPPSCRDPQGPERCRPLGCLEGCFCPTGTVWHGGVCVPPSSCPCFWGGFAFPEGAETTQGCSNCSCHGGRWRCERLRSGSCGGCEGCDEGCDAGAVGRPSCPPGRVPCPDGSCAAEGEGCGCGDACGPRRPTATHGATGCGDGRVACGDGGCVPRGWLCDGDADCADGSDEEGCDSGCAHGDFSCANATGCVPPDQLCDGHADCADGSDEDSDHCGSATAPPCPGLFACDDGVCLNVSRVCDGARDCPQGEDELGCGEDPPRRDPAWGPPGRPNGTRGPCPEFDCGGGECVTFQQVCDGVLDCEAAAGPSRDEEACGSWGRWGRWGPCSRSCGPGRRRRLRGCRLRGPRRCRGHDTQEQPCFHTACPEDGVWGSWGPWSPCVGGCGGVRVRRRLCRPPQNGGRPCTPRHGHPVATTDIAPCEPCPNASAPCAVGLRPWPCAPCPATCEDLADGSRCHHRACSPGCWCSAGLVLDVEGGHCVRRGRCPCQAGALRLRPGQEVTLNCHVCTCSEGQLRRCRPSHHCHVHCGWSSWSPWGECPGPCGTQSVQWSFRSPTNPSRRGGGRQCRGIYRKARRCRTAPCRQCHHQGQRRGPGERWREGPCRVCQCLPGPAVSCSHDCPLRATGCPQGEVLVEGHGDSCCRCVQAGDNVTAVPPMRPTEPPSVEPPGSTVLSFPLPPPGDSCYHPLDVANLPDSSFSVSWPPGQELQGPLEDTQPPFLQVDLLEPTNITGLVLQGGGPNDTFVTAFQLQFSNDGRRWHRYREGNLSRLFQGSRDAVSPSVRLLARMLQARHVRIVPQGSHHHLVLRVELLGCPPDGDGDTRDGGGGDTRDTMDGDNDGTRDGDGDGAGDTVDGDGDTRDTVDGNNDGTRDGDGGDTRDTRDGDGVCAGGDSDTRDTRDGDSDTRDSMDGDSDPRDGDSDTWNGDGGDTGDTKDGDSDDTRDGDSDPRDGDGGDTRDTKNGDGDDTRDGDGGDTRDTGDTMDTVDTSAGGDNDTGAGGDDDTVDGGDTSDGDTDDTSAAGDPRDPKDGDGDPGDGAGDPRAGDGDEASRDGGTSDAVNDDPGDTNIVGPCGPWGSWGSCSRSCGLGVSLRRRALLGGTLPGPRCHHPRVDTRPCFHLACPVSGAWGPWGPWSPCEVPCGGGSRRRTRSCTDPPPKNGGRGCPGGALQSQPCNLLPCRGGAGCRCPSGLFLQRGRCVPLTQCDCHLPEGTRRPGGRPSRGTATTGGGTGWFHGVGDTRWWHGEPAGDLGWWHWGDPGVPSVCLAGSVTCDNVTCPGACGWSAWSPWSSCSSSCGRGTRQRFRSPSNPAASAGGEPCAGPGHEEHECHEPCGHAVVATSTPEPNATIAVVATSTPEPNATISVLGSWSPWSPWSLCDRPCGGGRSERSRSCSHPPTQNGGTPCPGPPRQLRGCNGPPCGSACPAGLSLLPCALRCPRSCQDLGGDTGCEPPEPCESGCGCPPGTLQQDGACVPPGQCECRDARGGSWEPGSWHRQGCAQCRCQAGLLRCDRSACRPRPCAWSSWGQWGPCSVTCGSGNRHRYRSQLGEASCNETQDQALSCVLAPCPPSCPHGGTERALGEWWPQGPCQRCTCTPEGVQCHHVPCHPCPEGEVWAAAVPPGGCERSCREVEGPVANCSGSVAPRCACRPGRYRSHRGRCVPAAQCECWHRGTHRPAGSEWQEGCEFCRCSNGTAACAPRCAPLHCPRGLVKVQDPSGCCPVCREPSLAPPGCRRLQELRTISRGGCSARSVEVAFCAGHCASRTLVSAEEPYLQSVCECCSYRLDPEQPVRELQLPCPDGRVERVLLPVIHSCQCSSCQGGDFSRR
ncbi:LOW QUALITY PROTEIN: SCO-spondin-like [Phaenicophaeus curvirostris]|uniref:LOW QUALITY PROTEIN: SCO-spondin-like n=1 Tax=Phaenicophaeus curvirostris TaxID=33595 RepID=UPI0037F0ED04